MGGKERRGGEVEWERIEDLCEGEAGGIKGRERGKGGEWGGGKW